MDREKIKYDKDEALEARLITPKEAARMCSVTTQTLRNWRIPHVILPGGHRRYRLAEVMKLTEGTGKLPKPDKKDEEKKENQ